MGASREDIIRRLQGLGSQEAETSQPEPQEMRSENATRQQRRESAAQARVNTGQEQLTLRETIQPGLDLVADFNTGMANLAGIFGTADELVQSSLGVQNPDSILPNIEEIRQVGSSIGATRAPGVEASSVAGRFAEELGAGAVPFVGAAAKTSIPLIRLAGAELTSAAGATGGGIYLENSPSFQSNPYLGRAIGELLGGTSALSITDLIARSPKGTAGATYRIGKAVRDRVVDTVRGEGAFRRGARRTSDVALSPESVSGRISQPTEVDVEAGVDIPATLASDPGINRLTAAVMNEDAASAEQLSRAFGEEATRLRATAFGSGDPDKVREFLEAKLMEAGTSLDASLKGLSRSDISSGQASRIARQNIENAYGQARAAEKRMWRSTPSNITVENPSVFRAWGNVLKETTTETGRRRLPAVLKREFGLIDDKTGRLTGGSLLENPTTKQLHELYSELGDLARSEADKAGGSAKTIRLLKDMRRSLLDDLSSVDGGERYKKAVNVSRQLNDRFTKGTVGNILGFSSRGAGTEASETLDTILRTTGEGRANAIKQLTKASPRTAQQVEDYMRDLFVTRAVNLDNQKLNTSKANQFLSENRATLDQFPELRQRLLSAIDNQSEVDNLLGKSNVVDMSIAQRERLGTGVFLKANPGEEISAILNARSGRPRMIRNLVEAVKEDETGNAFQGLKSAFVDNLFQKAGNSNVIDEFTQTKFVDGISLKNEIDRFSDDLISAGAFDSDEINRLKIIAERLSNIQRTMGSRPAQGGIISDAPSQILTTFARVAGAQGGRVAAGQLGGGTVQTPGIFSAQAQRVINRMTNDEARNVIIRAVKDKSVMEDLLKNPNRLEADKQREILDNLLMPLRDTQAVLPSVIARGAATVGQEEESQQQRQSVLQRLERLQGGGQ